MTYIIDVIYICDILMSFRTTYYSKSTGEEIFSLSLIAKNYWKHGMLLDLIATLSVLPSLLPISFHGMLAKILNVFAYVKMWRVLRIRTVISQTNYTSGFKTFLNMLFILFLLWLYMHVIGCILWKLFRVDREWVPPNEFGNMPMDYMDDALTENTFF